MIFFQKNRSTLDGLERFEANTIYGFDALQAGSCRWTKDLEDSRTVFPIRKSPLTLLRKIDWFDFVESVRT